MPTINETIERLTIETVDKGTAQAARNADRLAGSTDRLAVATEKSTRITLSAERAVNSLQRRYDVEYRQQQDVERATRQLNLAREQGLITLERQNQLLALQAQRHGAAGGLATVGQTAKLSTFQVQNLSYQINDLGQVLATGQSPFRAIVQQGSQIVQIFGPGVGIRGALSQLGPAIFQFLTNPLTLATIGLAAAAQGAVYLWQSVTSGGDEAEEVLKRHEDLIGRIRDSYGDAAAEVQNYTTESQKVLDYQLEQNVEQLRAQLRAGTDDLLSGFFGGGDEFGERQLNPGMERFAFQIGILQQTMSAAEPDVERFREALVDLVRARPELAGFADELFRSTDELDRYQRAIRAAEDAARGDRLDYKNRGEKGGGEPDADRKAREDAIREAERQAQAYARSVAGVERQTAALQIQIDTFGLSTEAAAAYRIEADLRAAALENNVSLTEAESAAIRTVAQDYADAAAKLEEMREAQDAQKEAARETQRAYDDLGRTLTGVLTSGKASMEDYLKIMYDVFALTRQFGQGGGADGGQQSSLFGNIVQSAVALGGSGGGSSAFAGIFHGGGMVGVDAVPARAVDPRVFARAPRYHDGLAPDEFPAILQRGEEVVPRGGRSGAAGPVPVIIENIGPPIEAASAQIERGPSGAEVMRIVTTINEKVYGLKKPTTART